MIALRFIVSFMIWLVSLPVILISLPVDAILLRTQWTGYTTIFGNAKWGRGSTNPNYNRSGYWAAFVWLALRNPVNNLWDVYFALPLKDYSHEGDAEVGDKTGPGFYHITMSRAWEYYWIKPYLAFGHHWCIRVRFGWKIYQKTASSKCPFVFAINPWQPYLGVL